VSALPAVHQARESRTIRDIRRSELATLVASDGVRAALALHGTPLLVLDTDGVRRQYRRLRAALPGVRFHYAVKALSHDDVVRALADEGCGFDIATRAELDLVARHGVGAERVIHTHPVKKPADIAAALAAGVRTFVVDNEAELDKFAGAPRDTRILIRLSYRSPQAKSDLSSKFGVGPFEAGRLVAKARDAGLRVAGFSFHVGSQLDDPQRFADATADTLTLMEHLEHEFRIRFDTLDIGGGFPVAYDTAVTPLEEIAAAIRPILETRARHLRVIAEPGRFLVAEAMALLTSVVGVAERSDGRWYYLDDGVYGSYSNVVAEDVHPLVFAVRELDREDLGSHRWATLAGPTCDSADVIGREVMLPDMRVGDVLVSPAMGAYTTVTASHFNGIAATAVAVVTSGPVWGAIATVGASRHAVAA
jgi:ornithine decarboxylase